MMIVLQNDIQNMSTTRTDSINVRVTKDVKSLAVELAAAKGMTLAAYIVHLINVDRANSQTIISKQKIEV